MEEITYNIEFLDNGIVLTDIDNNWAECEKYSDNSDNGYYKEQSIINLIGKNIWSDIIHHVEDKPIDKVKITIKIEEIK